jgi:hypothetical protein
MKSVGVTFDYTLSKMWARNGSRLQERHSATRAYTDGLSQMQNGLERQSWKRCKLHESLRCLIMKDDEARYLIDQYNKFASYRMGETHFQFSNWAVVFAACAILTSVIPIAWRGAQLDVMTSLVFPLVILTIAALFAILAFRNYHKAHKQHENDMDILMLLEDYRSTHKGLPDTITLGKITNLQFKAEDLEKLLAESESGPTTQI